MFSQFEHTVGFVISHDTQNAQRSRTKHCNNHLKLLNNIKEIQQKEQEAGWTQMEKTETDCIGVILN